MAANPAQIRVDKAWVRCVTRPPVYGLPVLAPEISDATGSCTQHTAHSTQQSFNSLSLSLSLASSRGPLSSLNASFCMRVSRSCASSNSGRTQQLLTGALYLRPTGEKSFQGDCCRHTALPYRPRARRYKMHDLSSLIACLRVCVWGGVIERMYEVRIICCCFLLHRAVSCHHDEWNQKQSKTSTHLGHMPLLLDNVASSPLSLLMYYTTTAVVLSRSRSKNWLRTNACKF